MSDKPATTAFQMKYLFLFMLSAISVVAYSQDTIFLRENNIEFKAKVTEVTDEVIKYKKWENLDGPTYNLNISSISKIRYKNGQEDNFSATGTDATNPIVQSASALAPSKINTFPLASGYPKVGLVNVPYWFENGAITELEKADYTRNKQHSGAWGRMWVITVAGIASNIRLPKQDPLQFIIQLDDPKGNPFSICELHLCEVKAQRQFIDTKKGMHGEVKQEAIKLDAKALNDTGLYMLAPAKKLAKGEYIFTITDDSEVYAFSIGK
ncbi:MAG: hypothetical protein EOO51_01670 [Flavobacterium sp.]|nr:MAG: hypothetical protein EOO51_01670 [Flavobacterium sp.]